MTDIPRQWLRWLARLLPKQTAHGDHAIQIGQVRGEAQVHIDRATHITHQHFYAAPPLPEAANTPRMSADQREVLALMKQLPRRDYHQVLAFMRREFDTGLVHQLGPQQLYRVRRYVQTIQRNEERERA
ncbi:MAG: hypothetical protein JSR28_14140 [Proteobacteria bacterium]|nr:hypothetical protein [Pseudomonadota bacterium]